MLARLGGEEFVVLTHAPLPQAREAAERLRADIAAQPVAIEGCVIDVRVSLGVAVAHDRDTDGNAVLARADSALYEAKKSGRDCVRVEPAHLSEARAAA